jgi:hypothetical protein
MIIYVEYQKPDSKEILYFKAHNAEEFIFIEKTINLQENGLGYGYTSYYLLDGEKKVLISSDNGTN